MKGGIITNPLQISQDANWHRWVDGVVILIIGLAAGLVLAQATMAQEVTTTEVIRRRTMTVPDPQIESGASTEIPSGSRVEEG